MYKTIQQIKDANKTAGGGFFNPDRMREFWTWIGDEVINGNMFITSENQSLASQRLFTIRRVFANGLIGIVGKFQQYEFYEDARDAARRLGGGDGVEGGSMLTPGTIVSKMKMGVSRIGAPTWTEAAAMYPEFVQWVVQRKGGTPTGSVLESDWEKWRVEYLQERDST